MLPMMLVMEGRALSAAADGAPQPGQTTATAKPGGPAEDDAHLKLSGSKSSQFQYTFMDGPSTGFFTNGLTRRETLDLKLSGALEGGIKVLGAFQQSDDLLDDKISLSLAARHWELYLGDLSAELPGAEMILRPHQLSGARFSGNFERFGWTALTTVPKGQSRYLRVFGNGTQGPYPLGAAPVVPESEVVYVEKERMARGSDYEVDYFNGHIVFKNAVIEPNRVIEVVFQSRDTPYERQLHGIQLFQKPHQLLTLRQNFAYQWDRGAPISAPLAITPAAAPNPATHYALGNSLEYEDKRGRLAAEYAFSERNLNNLAGDYLHGHAGRASFDYELGAWKLKSGYKRTGENFQAIGGVDQGEDLLEYGAILDYRPNPVVQAAAGYNLSRRRLATGSLSLGDAKARLELTPRKIPSLKYQYVDETREDAGVTSPLGPLLQRTRRHLGELGQDIGFGRISAQYELEKLNGQSSLQGVTATPNLESSAGAATATLSLDRLSWITAVVTGTYKAGRLQDPDFFANNLDFTARALKSDLSLRAGESLTVSGGGQWMEDSYSGPKNTLNGKLTLRHGTVMSLESAYQWDSLQMFVFSSYRPADTQTTSGRLELSPWRPVNVAVSANQRLTRLKDSGQVPNSQEGLRGTLKWAPISSLSLEAGGGRDIFSLLNTADPLLPLQSEQALQAQQYSAKYSLGASSSIEAGYSLDETDKRQLALLTGQYDRARSLAGKGNLAFKSAMSQALRLEGGYRWKSFSQEGSAPGTLTLTALPLSALVQEAQGLAMQTHLGNAGFREDVAEAKMMADMLDWLSFGASAAYGSTLRAGLGAASTAVEGISLGIRFARINGEVEYKVSQTMEATGQVGQHHVAGNLSYRPLEFLTAALRGEYTKMNDTQATRISLNVTESF